MNSFTPLLLSFSILFSALAGGASGEPSAERASSPVTVSAVQADTGRNPTDIVQAAVSGALTLSERAKKKRWSLPYADMEYIHYDPEEYYSDIERMKDLADSGNAAEVCTIYDALYDEFLYIDALSVLSMLRYEADFNDEYWSGEYTYMNTLWSETQDALLTACSYVLDTSCARAFSAHIGRDSASLFRSYDAISEEDLDISTEELEILDEYYALYDTIDDIPFSYQGTTWTLRKLSGFRGTALAYADYDKYLVVYNGLQQALTETFAPLYARLTEIWAEEAISSGYDSFADYAYDAIYWRDYSPEDAQRFCDAVKPIARAYYEDLYYSDISYASDSVQPVMSGEELIAALGEYLPRVDESLLEPWNAMTSRGLFDLAPAAAGRFDGAYTTSMIYYHAPFMFASLSGDCLDLTTVTHEFGHYADFWFTPQTNVFTQVDDMDLSEIHSNALQALFTAFYGEIFEEGADVAEFINLSQLLENIFDGCIYDEFQRRVMADPTDLTAEKLNRIHTEVCAEYGMYDLEDRPWDGTWVYISHNFDRPLYYFSYAASAMAALQIWDMAQTDYDAAVSVYMDVLRRGAHDQGYFQVLEECGLLLFTEDGAAEAVCRPVLDRLTELDQAWDG